MIEQLTAEQAEALRSVPLGSMPNKVGLAIAMLKLSQVEISQQTGIARPNLSAIVTGRYKNLHVDTARKLADFFGCTIEDLFPARQAVAS